MTTMEFQTWSKPVVTQPFLDTNSDGMVDDTVGLNGWPDQVDDIETSQISAFDPS